MKDIEIKTKEGQETIVKNKSIAREILEWILCFVAAFVIAVLVRYFLFTPTLVKQPSMTPTIKDGERVLINRVVRTFNLPLYRGDIITFEKPSDTVDGVGIYIQPVGMMNYFTHNVLEISKISYIKRVIGLEGDHVLIKNGKVYVNDQELSEIYLNGIETPAKGDFCDVYVPEDHIFVMGDNRSGSTDSRDFGCIPIDKVEGRVSFRIWPFERWGKIDK